MKRYAILITLLAGCAGSPKPYTCFDIKNNNNQILKNGDIFCVSDADYNRIQRRSYDQDLTDVFLILKVTRL